VGAGLPERPFSGYRSRFSHKDERAEPGYYKVRLSDNEVDVELTASDRVGLHRYRYAKGAEAKVMLDLRAAFTITPPRICGRACACATTP
jgi:putative alpha-1,2-mannosidase